MPAPDSEDMRLTEQERTFIATRVAALEARTGTQLVTAVVDKSDSYPEAPWKAFALGAVLGAACAAAWQLVAAPWEAGPSGMAYVQVILGGGALLASGTLLLPRFARLFIDRFRRDAETTQFAQALFFTRGLDRTRGRVGLLVLVSAFERKVVILADAGFDGRVGPRIWEEIARRLTFLLRHRDAATALLGGLDALEAALLMHGFASTENDNIFPDEPIEIREGF